MKGHASSDAPWCAVINLGMGDARWDCRYRTVEECVPHVIVGDRVLQSEPLGFLARCGGGGIAEAAS